MLSLTPIRRYAGSGDPEPANGYATGLGSWGGLSFYTTDIVGFLLTINKINIKYLEVAVVINYC